jgi:hypothetical protein
MPRYLIERPFPLGIVASIRGQDAETCFAVAANNAEEGVTWLHSYVTLDSRVTYCLYEGPSPEALRRAAARNKLPISRITEVRVLDPYFYFPTEPVERP